MAYPSQRLGGKETRPRILILQQGDERISRTRIAHIANPLCGLSPDLRIFVSEQGYQVPCLIKVIARELTDSPYRVYPGELMVALSKARLKNREAVCPSSGKFELCLLANTHVSVFQQSAQLMRCVL